MRTQIHRLLGRAALAGIAATMLIPAGTPTATAASTAAGPDKPAVVSVRSILAIAPDTDRKGPVHTGPALDRVNWRNATVVLPRLWPTGPHCDGGLVTFVNGRATVRGSAYRILPPGKEPVYADIIGDSRAEALIPVQCGPVNSEYSDTLVAFTGQALRPRGFGSIKTNTWTEGMAGVRVTDKKVVEVTVKEHTGDYPRTQIRGFAWNGSAFRQVSGPTEFPPEVNGYSFDWSTATLTIPFKGAGTTIQPNDRTCPRVTVTFTRVRDGEGVAQAGGCE